MIFFFFRLFVWSILASICCTYTRAPRLEPNFSVLQPFLYPMFARQSIVKQLVRNASTKSDRITVQLLQDFEPLGTAGELVRVKPAFMRNFLHVGNKACYITNGPRIPVVERKREPVVTQKVKAPKPTQAAEDPVAESGPAMSLDELSSLFSSMRGKKGTTASSVFQTQETTSVATYSLAELGESLPATYSLSGIEYPLTREALAQVVFNSTGIEVPASVIKVTADGVAVDEIVAPGTFTWSFLAPGDANVLKRKLKVQ